MTGLEIHGSQEGCSLLTAIEIDGEQVEITQLQEVCIFYSCGELEVDVSEMAPELRALSRFEETSAAILMP